MMIIAGISTSVSGVFAAEQAGLKTRDSSLSQERGKLAPTPQGTLEGLTVRFWSHNKINADLGQPNDPATRALFEFVAEALKK